MLRRLAVNTSSNVAVLAVSIITTFILTPILVRNLGKYDYGLWEMLVAVLGYAGILELGLRPTVSRFTAKYHAQRDSQALRRLFSTSLAFLTLAGVVVACVFAAWGVFAPHSVAPEGESPGPYAIALLIIGTQVLAAFPGHVAESVLEGLQKYYLKNMVAILKMVIGCSLIVIFISQENALILLAAVSSAGLWIRNFVFFILVARESRESFRFSWGCCSFSELRELVVFGGKSLVQGVSYRIETMTDSLVIGLMLGPAMVPLYSIPANLVQYIRNICSSITHAFMPLFSSLDAAGEVDKIRRIYIVASKIMVGLIMPMGAGAVLLGPPFLEIWIGPEIAEHSQVIILLLVAFLTLPFLNPFASRYLTAINRHGIFAVFSPVSAVLNLGLSILLVIKMGIVGAALASLIAVSAVFPIYLWYTAKHLQIGVMHYVRLSILPAVIPTVLMAGAVAFYRYEAPPASYLDLGVGVLIGVVVYVPLFVLLSLTAEERGVLMGRLVALGR